MCEDASLCMGSIILFDDSGALISQLPSASSNI